MVYLKKASAFFLIFSVILLVAFLIILFARGYRPNWQNGELHSQGILVTNSAPNNAEVYLNGKFKGLTPNNLYLQPGKYEVLIKKEGYNPWRKTYLIKGEVVSRTDTQLFSNNPSLSPLTNRGVNAPSFSSSKEKIVYFVLPEEVQLPNSNPEENGGLFISNISSQTLSLFKSRLLLIPNSQLDPSYDLTKTRYVFSPNEKTFLVFFYDEKNNLLSVKLVSTTNKADVFDVTLSFENLLQKWNTEQTNLQNKIIETFPKKIAQFLTQNAQMIDVSPDKTKILYFALENSKLPLVITPPLIGSVPTSEQRLVSKGNYYIYDIKEDKNFLLNFFAEKENELTLQRANEIKTKEPSLDMILEKQSLFTNISWYIDSRHLIFDKDDTMFIVEYDGQNQIVVYSGPFEKSFNGVTSDGKLIILTNINPKKNQLSDLYTVSIK